MVTRIVLLVLVLFVPRLAAAADVLHQYIEGDKTVSHVVLKWTRSAANWQSPAVTVFDAKAQKVPKSLYHQWQKGWTVRIKSNLVKTSLLATNGKAGLRQVCAQYAQTDCVYRLAKINSLAGDTVLPERLNVPIEFTPTRPIAALAPTPNGTLSATSNSITHATSQNSGTAAPGTNASGSSSPKTGSSANDSGQSGNDDKKQQTSARTIILWVMGAVLVFALLLLILLRRANKRERTVYRGQKKREVMAYMQLFFQKFKEKLDHPGHIDKDQVRVEYEPRLGKMRAFVLPGDGNAYPNLNSHAPRFRQTIRDILRELGEPFIMDGDPVLEEHTLDDSPQLWIVVPIRYQKDRLVNVAQTTQEVA